MTERSYQEARKLMRSINYMRGLITAAKGNVAKWGAMEDVNRKELREAQANGCKKQLEKAMAKLNELRDKFAAIKFPDSNLPDLPTGKKQCEICGDHFIGEGDYCKNH